MNARHRAKLRAQWEANRKQVADRWFIGDETKADLVLNALPYSAIPCWADVETVMEEINRC